MPRGHAIVDLLPIKRGTLFGEIFIKIPSSILPKSLSEIVMRGSRVLSKFANDRSADDRHDAYRGIDRRQSGDDAAAHLDFLGFVGVGSEFAFVTGTGPQVSG